jgi:hypothetical protein
MTPPAAHEKNDAASDLIAIVEALAACDPRPTIDDSWCYFCGQFVKGPGAVVGHREDCLWLRAHAALPGEAVQS